MDDTSSQVTRSDMPGPGVRPLGRRRRSPRALVAAGAAILLVAGAVACGDDPDPEPSEATQLGGTTRPADTTPDGEPRSNDPEAGEEDLLEDREGEGVGGQVEDGRQEGGSGQDGGSDEGASGGAPVGVPVAAMGRVTLLTSGEARTLLEARPDTLVIDVRSQEEYLARHVVGAQHIEVENRGLWDRRVEALDRDRPTVVYCRSGNRSAQAAEKLLALGFTQVYDLGGIGDWNEGDLPLDR